MQTEALKTYLNATLLRVLKPLARIALRGQLTYKEFAETAKLAFFEVAREDFGLDGRKTNISRVAILTGLSRKECTRLKGVAAARAPQEATAMSPSTRVLAAWYEDPAYRDAEGRPRALVADGPAPSVASLFKAYAGDIPYGALLTELRRIGAVEELSDGRLRAVRRSFIPSGFDRDKIRILGNQLADLGATVFHNVSAAELDGPRMQRYVVNDAIAGGVARQFQDLATDKGQALLEDLDAWLSANAASGDGAHAGKDLRRVGVGIYYFEDSAHFGEDS